MLGTGSYATVYLVKEVLDYSASSGLAASESDDDDGMAFDMIVSMFSTIEGIWGGTPLMYPAEVARHGSEGPEMEKAVGR